MGLKIGDKLKDNDPRMKWRGHLTIIGLGLVTHRGVERVRARGEYPPEVSISVARIYNDGKPRRSGFDLLPAGEP